MTDKECTWNWRYARCEPRCQCSFQLRLGDYSMDRSCRLVDQEPSTCDENALELSGWAKAKGALTHAKAGASRTGLHVFGTVQRGLKHAASEASKLIVRGFRAVHGEILKRAPPSDKDCDFNFDGLK